MRLLRPITRMPAFRYAHCPGAIAYRRAAIKLCDITSSSLGQFCCYEMNPCRLAHIVVQRIGAELVDIDGFLKLVGLKLIVQTRHQITLLLEIVRSLQRIPWHRHAVIIDQMYPQFLELGGTRCTRGNLEEKLFWVAIA